MFSNRITCAAMLIFGASRALAGPCWVEPTLNDAGNLPPTAQFVVGPGGGGGQDLVCILGELDATESDFQDVFLIYISDPVNFSARSVLSFAGHPTTFDTQIWLFKADPNNSTSAMGLLGNNDDPSLPSPPTLSFISPPATDGTGQTIPGPGFYYLAVSGGDGGGAAANVGSIPTDAGNQNIFNQVNPTEISGPDGPGGGNDFANWTAGAQTGTYAITLQGAQFLPQSPVPAESPSANLALILAALFAGALALRARHAHG